MGKSEGLHETQAITPEVAKEKICELVINSINRSITQKGSIKISRKVLLIAELNHNEYHNVSVGLLYPEIFL